MKKLYFKKSIQTILEIVLGIGITALFTTIESEWTLQYFQFVGVNIAIVAISGILLAKHGRYED